MEKDIIYIKMVLGIIYIYFLIYIFFSITQVIMEIGLMINNMVLGQKNGLIIQFLKVNFAQDSSMAKENLFGLTDLLMRVNLKIIVCKAKVYTNGPMEDNIQDNGKIVKWKAVVYLHEKMVENLRDSM